MERQLSGKNFKYNHYSSYAMDFLGFLKVEESSARLIFGKKELEIIKKQLLGLQMTQSERNRLSKFIRPKLQFMEKCVEFKQEFELIRKEKFKLILSQTLNACLEDKLGKNICAILLFGSHVDETAIWRSDIDIAVIFDEDISSRDQIDFTLRLQIPEIVQISIFNSLPIYVKASLIKNYKVLYKNRKFDEDFWIQVIKQASESRVIKEREEKWIKLKEK